MKLATLRYKMAPAAVKIPHWVAVTALSLGSAFVTGIANYVQAVPATEIFKDLGNAASVEHLALGALVGGVTALAAQAGILIHQWAAAAAPTPMNNVTPPGGIQT